MITNNTEGSNTKLFQKFTILYLVVYYYLKSLYPFPSFILIINMNSISKVLTRFYEWLYHPSIRWHKYSKALVMRVPSPASEPKDINLHNYKQPYTHSPYNVRFRYPTHHQAVYESSFYAADAIQAPTVPQKLIQAGLLKKQDQNNKQAIESAKTQWFKKYKTPVEQKQYKNDFGWKIPDFDNPETFRYLNDMRIKVNAYELQVLRGVDQIDRIYNMKTMGMDWMCYYAGDPEFQQMLIEVFYKLDGLEKQNIQRGYIPLFHSSRNFWKALDSINDSDNILRVESHIKDPSPLDFSLSDSANVHKKIKFERQRDGTIKALYE